MVQVDVPVSTSLNGPRPARIERVITRVTRNVMMNASIRRSRGSFSGSTMLRSHQDIPADGTRRGLGPGAGTAPAA